MAAVRTVMVRAFYMIAEMVGAGALVKLLLGGYVTYNKAVIGVGILMIVYVVFGGMLATTWVQIVKAILLMAGAGPFSVSSMARFPFCFSQFFWAVPHVTDIAPKVAQGGEGFPPP